MAESMDMAFDSPEAEGEADSVYNQICEEQGIAMAGEAMNVGTGAVSNGQQQAEKDMASGEVDELQKRLDNLNK